MTKALQRRPDGFFERGHQVTRMEAFVDAAFAFAVTLLVISLNSVPDSAETLIVALKRIPAFACSFALIAIFWHSHNVWSRRFGLDDGRSIVLSLVLVFLVLVYVFPLRILFAAFFAWVSQGALPADYRIATLADLSLMFVVYAIAFGSLGLLIIGLNLHALRSRARIGLDALEVLLLRREILALTMMPATALASMALASAIDEDWSNWALGTPGLVYCLLGFSGLLAHYGAHEEAALRADAGA